jgi:hypothetical protein
MAGLVATTAAMRGWLVAVRDLALKGAELRLYSLPHSPAVGGVTADLVECAFAGYAPQALGPWGVPYEDGAGRAIMDGPVRTFRCTGPSPGQQAAGYYVLDGGGQLLWSEAAVAPAAMAAAGATFRVLPRLRLSSPA